jgi:hypothetical protein
LWTAAARGRLLLHPDAMSETTQPMSASMRDTRRLRVLREEVGRLRQRETRRRFDPCIHVGELGGPRTGFVIAARDLPVMDVGLRVDVASRLLMEAPPTWSDAWLVRPGTAEQHDVDLQWFSALRTAFAMHSRSLEGCYVITRTGWRDVVNGETRSWVRLRL